MTRILVSIGVCGLLAACEAGSMQSGRFLSELPEGVAEVVGPNQNLNAVKLMEEDGCFWYQHAGPVETTMLPLLSKRGRHICTQREEAAAPAS